MVAFSLREFLIQLDLLARMKLICIVSISHSAFERWHRGAIQRVKRNEGRFEILGDSFALYLREENIGSILLVNDSGDEEAGPAVEIHNRSGCLLARIQSPPEPEANARWRDAMVTKSVRAVGA